MASLDKPLPVTLPTRPTCNDCVVWSEDDVAVAAGEYVHILTPKRSLDRSEAAGHPQWHINSIRTNLFEQREWPEQVLDTISDFSIGEEQTSSLIVALRWSNEGLGIHRRPVLGILTSNLVLSLWETDGIQAHYQRTCTINTHLARKDVFGEQGTGRRALRIRHFAWLPSLKTSTQRRWGVQYLVFADDNQSITIIQISKSKAGSFGQWSFVKDLQLTLNELGFEAADTEQMSPLQRRLYEQTPITAIETGDWHEELLAQSRPDADSMDVTKDKLAFLLPMTVRRGAAVYTTCIRASVSNNGQKILLSRENLPDSSEMSTAGITQVGPPRQTSDANVRNDHCQTIAQPEIFFREAIEPLCENFNATFKLSGHFRTRFWGSAVSPEGSQAVACITLHPSDMIEYTIPSAERCILAFQRTSLTGQHPSPPSSPINVAQEQILQFAFDQLKHINTITSSLDWKLLFVYSSLSSRVLNATSELRTHLVNLVGGLKMRNAEQQHARESMDDQQQYVAGQINNEWEDCDICGNAIAFTDDTTTAICGSNHQFSRCQLSFVAIQEPGISKYCSRCGKQFLNLTKLGPDDGFSFSQAVFDKFDVCPYCHAKFRG